MHIVIFGLTISSSWGNGHATLWRSLVRAMLRRGHTVSFYERDVPYYAANRDLHELPVGGRLHLYTSLDEVRGEAQRDCDRADLALATSFCPDGPDACRLILESGATLKAFYDLDTPVTLHGLRAHGSVAYLPAGGLGNFDFVLSYTGGRALDELKSRLHARAAFALYGSVDPESHYPVAARDDLRSSLSYLGTYAPDRQAALERLFVAPAGLLPAERFLIGGAQYPESFPWRENIAFIPHVPPEMHPAFFASSRGTLNVTRAEMASYGFCPSGRLFEAAACGVPLLSDTWEGLGDFFRPGSEIIAVETAQDVVDALSLGDTELRRVADAARARTLAEHTGACRVRELEAMCDGVLRGLPVAADAAVAEDAVRGVSA